MVDSPIQDIHTMIEHPKPLTITGTATTWLDRLRRATLQNTPKFGFGVNVAKTTRGTSYTVRKKTGGGGSADTVARWA